MGIQKPNMQALWADQGAIIAPTDSKVRLGWTAEVPPNQWENWVQNRQDRALAYLMQKGIPEWDSVTEYIANKSFVQKGGKIYKCIATNTGNDPETSTTFWDGGLGLGLGTAAYSSLTTSSTDTTAGRVLKVGDYGLGTQSTLPDGTGFSTLPVGGNYQISGNHPDAPSAGGGSLHVGGSSSLKTYLYIQNNTRKVYVKSGTSQWTELWSGLNFNPSDKADKTTTISAGTGLSGGGNLSQNRSLSVAYGTTANTAAQGNDSRIVNALQRAGNLSDLTNTTTARANLGLGTAAVRDTTTNSSDPTSGRVLRVGDFGIGGDAVTVSGDWNDVDITGIYMGQNMSNAPFSGWVFVHCYRHNGQFADQIAYSITGGNYARMSARRKVTGVWEDWHEFFHNGNLSPVDTMRQINAGIGLTGGGNLSQNRTLSIVPATPEQARGLTSGSVVITPENLGSALRSHVIGMGQTRQNVTSSRNADTNYTNTTGRSIFCQISVVSAVGGNCSSVLFVGGSSAGTISISRSEGAGVVAGTHSFIVLPGEVYRVTATGGTTIEKWTEVR